MGNLDNKPAPVETELMKALRFAAEDTVQAIELAEILLEVYPPAPENAPMVARMVVSRLVNAAMLVTQAVKDVEQAAPATLATATTVEEVRS